MIVKKEVNVDNEEIEKSMGEVLKVRTVKKGGRRALATVCVPPKTNKWRKENYEEMLRDISKYLRKITKGSSDYDERLQLHGSLLGRVEY